VSLLVYRFLQIWRHISVVPEPLNRFYPYCAFKSLTILSQ
jgi:hypothetical protein